MAEALNFTTLVTVVGFGFSALWVYGLRTAQLTKKLVKAYVEQVSYVCRCLGELAAHYDAYHLYQEAP